MSSRRLPDGRWEHRFRQSWLNTLSHCPEQARAQWLGEFDEDEHTDSTALGTAVHAGIEVCLQEQADGQGPLDVDDCVEVARMELERIGEWKYTKYPYKRVPELAEKLVTTWYDHVRPHVRPSLVEHHFSHALHEDTKRVILVSGTIDCVDDDLLVWDWKTGSRPYEPWEYQRWAVQPTAYTWAIAQEFEAVDRRGPWWFRYAILRTDGEVQYLKVRRGEPHVEWLRKQALAAAELIEQGLDAWPLNDAGWWCSDKWCPKFAECKGAVMAEDWTVTEKAHEPEEAHTCS